MFGRINTPNLEQSMVPQIPLVTVQSRNESEPFDAKRPDLTFSMIWGILLASIGARFRLQQTSLGNRGNDEAAYACMVFAFDRDHLPFGDGLVIRVRKMGAGDEAEFVEVEIDPRRFPCAQAWQGRDVYDYDIPSPANKIKRIDSLEQLQFLIESFDLSLSYSA